MLDNFGQKGKASFILGGQFGSEGKGASAALVGMHQKFDIYTTNASAQAGHTSIHNGRKRVVFHLPTAPLIAGSGIIYLNAGCAIDPDVLVRELDEHYQAATLKGIDHQFFIHPNAAVITDDCRAAEMREDSAQTRIASTRKGVGEALARKVLRSGQIARDHPFLKQFVRRIDLNSHLLAGKSVLVEVPQGIGLSLNGKFYPHCTSRDCTVMQAASDAGIHPSFVGKTLLTVRTFPIRVGNIAVTRPVPVTTGEYADPSLSVEYRRGYSGGCYHDQREITWRELGVEPEITTVTKRVRRVFTFSRLQLYEAMASARPDVIHVTFCDYATYDQMVDIVRSIVTFAKGLKMAEPEILFQDGPTTADTSTEMKWRGSREQQF